MTEFFTRSARRTAGLLAGLLLASLMCVLPAQADFEPTRTMRVAFPITTGLTEIDEYGNHKGLVVDYLNEIAKYTGWAYEYIEVEPEDITAQFAAGKFDLVGGTYYNEALEAYYAYPDYYSGRSSALILCRQDDHSLHSYDLTTMNGKTIGVYEMATAKIRYLSEFLATNDLECELRYYSYAETQQMSLDERLLKGEIDLILGNEMDIGRGFRMVTSFLAQPYYIVARPGDTQTVDELNKALSYIIESTPSFAEDTYAANFPDMKTSETQLNDAELAYIAGKETVTVAVPLSWHPIYCADRENSFHDGILPDMLAQVSEFTGLEFIYVYADSYAESVELVRSGQADILGAYLGTSAEAFDDGLSASSSYVSISSMVLKNKSVPYPDSGLTFGVLRGRSVPSELSRTQVVYYDTIPELLEAVNRNDVDCVYGVSAMLEQEMQAQRYINVVPVSQADDNTAISFAVAQPVTPELLTILNKAVAHIPSAEKTNILNRNLVSVGYGNMTLKDLIYARPYIFMTIMAVILALIATACVLAVRARMKNAVMNSRIEAAEAKSLAKSEFLSRMSHEIRTPMNTIVGLADLTCMESSLTPSVEDKLNKIRGASQYLLALINDILDMSRIENGKMEIENRNFSLPLVLSELCEMMGPQARQRGLQFNCECRAQSEWLVGDPLRLRQILTNLLSNAVKFTPEGGAVKLLIEELPSEDGRPTLRFSVTDTGIGIREEDSERIFASFEQVSPSVSHSIGTGLGLPISRSIARLMGGDLEVKSEVGKGSEFYMTVAFEAGRPETVSIPEPESEGRSLSGAHILLAEDNDLNAEIAYELLTRNGMRITRAANGQETVDLYKNNPPGTYDAVLMDIRMPLKDGYEASREIRASGKQDADIPIIAMTADSFKEDEDFAIASGMDGFVRKPVDVGVLLSVLKEHL